MENEIIEQINEYKETIKHYQDVINRGKEFPNGFDSNGNLETNLTVAKRMIRNAQEGLKKYNGSIE